jgi:hypothetical protein
MIYAISKDVNKFLFCKFHLKVAFLKIRENSYCIPRYFLYKTAQSHSSTVSIDITINCQRQINCQKPRYIRYQINGPDNPLTIFNIRNNAQYPARAHCFSEIYKIYKMQARYCPLCY